MTKEELAKKRGVKLAKETQTPSEALVTTKNEQTKAPDPKQAKEKPKKETADVKKKAPVKAKTAAKASSQKPAPKKAESKPAHAEEPREKLVKEEKPSKNKGGRPKTRTEKVKIANIAIPESVFNNMSEYALVLYNSNMTEYINTLIRKDLEENLKNYKTVAAAMKKAKGGK